MHMKRSYFPLLLMLILVSCSGGMTDLDKAGLNGKVKSIVERQFNATHRDGKWMAGTSGSGTHTAMNYTSDGNYLESIVLTEAGDTLGSTRIKRQGGKMVEEVFRAMNGRTTRTILEWISDVEVNFEVWEGEMLHYEGANYYDQKGRIERQVGVVDEREAVNYFVYEKGLLVENYQENLLGERTRTQLYEYDTFDENGNWTSKLVYVGEEKIAPEYVIKREYTYY